MQLPGWITMSKISAAADEKMEQDDLRMDFRVPGKEGHYVPYTVCYFEEELSV